MLKIFKPKDIKIIAPMTGNIMSIQDVPDKVFAQKMIGDGLAIVPTDGLVVSPCQGRVVQIFPTNHAIGIETKEGLDLLIHLGIDTVELNGVGFERLVEEGQVVDVGRPLLKMSLDIIKQYDKSLISPIIVTTKEKISRIEVKTGYVMAGKNIIMNIRMK